MICHVSLPLDEPERAAPILAELGGGTAVRAPSPPFPRGAWLVCFGDAAGSLLELMPAGFVFDADAPLGLSRRGGPAGPSAAHVLLRSPLGREAVQAIAEEAGWRVQPVDTGLFDLLKVWVGETLVEFLTAPTADRYADTFGTEAMPRLDARLRRLEAEVAAALEARLGSNAAAALLGDPSER